MISVFQSSLKADTWLDNRLVRSLGANYFLRRTPAHCIDAVEHAMISSVVGDERAID